ncbi:MAG: TlpA family protein disulfide reductase [Gammaproteobacteria bacterium]|nr:TlpA family protein disulfide reductase [Gammaproteobacteria bacterium]
MKRIFVVALFVFTSIFSSVYAQDKHAVSAPVDFVLSDLDNKNHKLSDYRGKWVVVNYWATWCPPCVEEMPELVFFHDKHKDKDAVVLGINLEDVDDEKVRQFVDEHLITYPILLAEPAEEGPLGAIPGLPTTFLVDPQGRVVHRKIGRVDQTYLENQIKKFAH